MDKGQEKRVSEDDIALIKHFVDSREDASIVLRDFFLQFELNKDEQEFLHNLTPEFIFVLEKLMKPELIGGVPLEQEADPYARLVMLEQIAPDVGEYHIRANDILIDFMEQEFTNLKEGTEKRDIVLADLPKKLENDHDFNRVVNIMAYNLIIPIVGGRVHQLEQLIAPPDLTEAQLKERLKKDSTK